jgi:hypothetical protein
LPIQTQTLQGRRSGVVGGEAADHGQVVLLQRLIFGPEGSIDSTKLRMAIIFEIAVDTARTAVVDGISRPHENIDAVLPVFSRT